MEHLKSENFRKQIRENLRTSEKQMERKKRWVNQIPTPVLTTINKIKTAPGEVEEAKEEAVSTMEEV